MNHLRARKQRLWIWVRELKVLQKLQLQKKKFIVTILACVTWKMLKKEMLDHLDDVEQYYRWW